LKQVGGGGNGKRGKWAQANGGAGGPASQTNLIVQRDCAAEKKAGRSSEPTKNAKGGRFHFKTKW